MSTKFHFQRMPEPPEGEASNILTVRINLELDVTDKQAMKRLANILRALIPPEDREEFLAGFEAAAKGAHA